MSSKLEYLKRYEENNFIIKKKKRIKKCTNMTILDDDVATWEDVQGSKESNIDDPEDAPVVAEVQDDSIIKWQPLSSTDGNERVSPSKDSMMNEEHDLSPPRRTKAKGNKRKQDNDLSSDVSPPRSRKKRMLVDYKASRRTGGQSSSTKVEKKNETNEVEEKKRNVPTLIDVKIKSDSLIAKNSDQVFMEWGRGVAQTRDAVEKARDEEYEMSKPLARYADDEDLERMLKERTREGDPFLLFMKKTKKGKEIEAQTYKGKPVYKGESTPNRFGLQPGYRWDGVDRSNGYEKAWLTRISNNKALSEESYKWSTEDM